MQAHTTAMGSAERTKAVGAGSAALGDSPSRPPVGLGVGSGRTRWFPGSPLFLNPHIPWYMKSNPASTPR